MVPLLATTATFRPLLTAGIMALWSASCRGKRHGVGTGGERGTERRGERKGPTNGTGNRQGTSKGEADKYEEDNGECKRKIHRWWGTRRSTGSSTGEEVPIRFGTYNIRNGRNGGLESALRVMAQANIDLGILQETKCTEVIYTRESSGYSVVATDAPSRHRSGVAVFYRPSPLFAVEAVRQFGPNVVSFQLAMEARRWYIIGCYLSLNLRGHRKQLTWLR